MNRTPFRSSTISYSTSDSPSITMEKGTYRLRAPYAYNTAIRTAYPAAAKRHRSTNHRSSNLALLLVILTFASISSFGIAYYLYSTRWDARKLSHQTMTDRRSQGAIHDSAQGDTRKHDPDERFLAYLPHSGFHNQRIAFENALVLARLLNRTLLMPPIYLSDKRLRYAPFDDLYHDLSTSDKIGLRHCSRCHPDVLLPLECMSYFSYTQVSWEWLMDLRRIKASQRLLPRWNLTEAWIYDHLNISKTDVLFIKDTSPYHYRFLDTLTDVSPAHHKFLESLYIADLDGATERLIHVGTLFGSSRLRLKNPVNVATREAIRDSMSFSNSDLLRSCDIIINSLGPSYLGLHLRVGDGEFKKSAEINTHRTWWRLIHEILGYTQDEATSLAHIYIGERSDDQQWSDSGEVRRRRTRGRWPPNGGLCRGHLHTDSHLLRLNVPIFISTDVDNSPLLFIFHRTFPCIFYLSDFHDALNLLDGLYNPVDGVALKPFLLPFLDALVVGHSTKVVGTENSTFSRFAIDVLWRKFHNLTIVDRG